MLFMLNFILERSPRSIPTLTFHLRSSHYGITAVPSPVCRRRNMASQQL